MVGFLYNISTKSLSNGKARFYIKTLNDKFGVINIIKINVRDFNNQENQIEFNSEQIVYEKDDLAYIDIGEIHLSNSVYISSITLYDGNTYNVSSSNTNHYTFNQLISITPNYLYSFEDYDDISIIVNPNINVSLIYNNSENQKESENQIFCSVIDKKYTCLSSSIEYGIDYSINCYKNVILRTIKVSFDNRCYNPINSHNITFTLQSQHEITNISEFKVKLFNNENGNEEIDKVQFANSTNDNKGNYFYNFKIIPQGLKAGYYFIDINGERLNGSNITVDDVTIIKKIGDLFVNSSIQYFILQINHNLNYKTLKVFLNKDNVYIDGFCETSLDNKKTIICQINDKITQSGTYKLGYFDECSNKIFSDLSYDINNLSIPYPNETKIKHIYTNSDLYNITFKSIVEKKNISNIYLIKTSSLEEIEVNISNISEKNVSITIPKNLNLGNYLIKIKYSNDVIIIIPLVSIYDSQFDIKNYIPEVSISNFNIKNFFIQFKGLYNENQIIEVFIVYDQCGNEIFEEISFIYDQSKNGVIIKEDLIITNKEELHFELVGDIKSYSYYFHIIQEEGRFNLFESSLFLNPKNTYVDIDNHDGSGTFLNLTLESISTSQGLSFKFVYCNSDRCRFILNSDTSDIDQVIQTELIFNLKNSEEYRVLPITFIPKNYYWLPIRNYYNYFKYIDAPYESNYRAVLDDIFTKKHTWDFLNEAHKYKVLFPYTEIQDYNIIQNKVTLDFESKQGNHTFVIQHPTKPSRFIISTLNDFYCHKFGHIYYINETGLSCESCSNIEPELPYKKDNFCTSDCWGPYQYQYEKHMQCYDSCSSVPSKTHLYEEGNKCVEECSEDYGLEFASSNTCVNCDSIHKYADNGYCKACDEENESWCRAPTYYSKDIKVPSCDSYECYNNESYCYIKNFEAYCECGEGFFGLRCELDLKNASSKAKELVDDFLVPTENGRISYDEDGELLYDLDNENNIQKIREISNLVKEPKIAVKVGRRKIKKLFHSVGTMIMKMVDGVIDSHPNILELFDLATNLVTSNLQIRGLLRNLDEENGINNSEEDEIPFWDEEEEFILNEEEEIEKLKDLLNQAREIYKLITFKDIENGDFSKESANVDYFKSRTIYYQRWYNNEESNKRIFEGSKANDELSIIDFSTCTAKETKIIYIMVSFSSNVRKVLENYENENNKTIINSYTDSYDITRGVSNAKKYYLSDCTNLTAYLPINYKEINLEKYKFYKQANIDIYNPNDKAFRESCYITNGFDYDLTQKFRKKEIYENKTFVSNDCEYIGIDTTYEKVKMLCQYKESFNYLYKVIEKHLDEKTLNRVDNLALKCASYVKNTGKNIGFWIYFVLTILVIGGTLYFTKYFYQTYIKKTRKKILFESEGPMMYEKKEIEEKENSKINEILKIKNDKISSEQLNETKIEEENIEDIEKNQDIDDKIAIETILINVEKGETKDDIINQKNENKKSEKSNQKGNESIESNLSNDYTISENNNPKDHPFDNFFEVKEIFNEIKDEIKSVNTYNINDNEVKENSLNDIISEKEKKKEKSFIKIVLRSAFEVYPLFTFWNKSIYTHISINICFFAFNFVLIFGFNSLLYTENIIEKRIKDINRNKFIYPLIQETPKIILSLTLSIIVMLVLRIINLIPRSKNEKLLELINSNNNIENIQEQKNTILKPFFIRRFISCLIMLIFTVFLFSYIIVFCSMYKHTQINWLYSGLWCLSFEWIVLTPLYILIISILEKKGKKETQSYYYIRQLFFC